ncbi:MAG: hypothetical protein DWP95_11450 [Proteobacteria bacterium]|nr:MAG: hypothetical protein DWP95_11450 [Pseudomonadota bacterium]
MIINNQTTAALAHSFIVTVLLVTFSWMGLVDFSWQKKPDSIEKIKTEVVPEDTLPINLIHEINVLKQAQRIESERFGASAQRSKVYQAYQTILAAQDAELIFKHLLNEQNIITKIYAMKGLQTLESSLFAKIEPYFANSQLSVQQIAGCVVFKKEVREIIDSRWPWH